MNATRYSAMGTCRRHGTLQRGEAGRGVEWRVVNGHARDTFVGRVSLIMAPGVLRGLAAGNATRGAVRSGAVVVRS